MIYPKIRLVTETCNRIFHACILSMINRRNRLNNNRSSTKSAKTYIDWNHRAVTMPCSKEGASNFGVLLRQGTGNSLKGVWPNFGPKWGR